MHVLFVHPNFPAQFGHIAARLAQNQWQCTFVSQLEPGDVAGIRRIQYQPVGGATARTPYLTRTFENAIAHAHGVYNVLRDEPDLKPDLIVAHSGFGSSLFLRELFDCPLINFFEFFYHARGSDLDFWPDTPPDEAKRLRARARNAMILLDLVNCDAGYTPTRFQHSVFPPELRPKLRVIFDGVDTQVYRRIAGAPRTVGGRTIGPDTRVVTYCARGFERMRGFDQFMKAAKLVYQRHPDVVFVAVGSDRTCYGDADAERGGHKSFRHRVLAQDEYDLTKFIFPGQVSPQQLASIFSLSDVHVYLTAPFVLSWSMMNAMACGAVVVGSDTEPVREMITDGENGLLAPFFEPEAIAERVLAVLGDPPRFAAMRRRAAEFIQTRYSLDAVLPQLVALFETTATSG